jgi:hypothetical protein
MTKLDIKNFSLMLGCIWSTVVFLLGIVAITSQWGERVVGLFAAVYIGYKATLFGSLIGAFWGFIDGAVTGALVAWVYNRFVN